MHQDQRCHVDSGEIECIPVSAERKVHADENDRCEAPLNVWNTTLDNGLVGIEQRKCRFGQLYQYRGHDRRYEQHEQQSRIQDGCGTFRAALAFAPCRTGLHAGRDSQYQRLAHEDNEPAEPDGRERGIAQEADHRRIHNVKEILRYHGPDDGQCKVEDAIAAFGFHDATIAQVDTMKVASFEVNNRASYGVILDGRVYEADGEWRNRYPDLCSVLTAGRLASLPAVCADAPLDAGDVSYLPVIPRPDKILCVGVNYRPHVEEMGRDIPEQPVVFVRFSGSVVGHGRPIVRPAVSQQFDYEGELAVIIGRRGRHVPRQAALDHVAGYTCFMDGSVRDWQQHTMQFTPGKNFDRSGAVGPCLVSREAISDPSQLQLQTRLNGEVVQKGRLDELIFDIPRLIEYCSTFTELLPGDLIATGTPGGVGAARTPPLWLQAGDTVEVDVDAIGVLKNPVQDEASSAVSFAHDI